ncbi:MAG: hypothetical protein ACIAQZ_02065 [Sedimentisphaeraceae bacterium JB056]
MLHPLEYIRALISLKNMYPYFLVSAYDIANADESHRKIMECHINEAVSSGVCILMDSGNYESYWKTSNWSQENFHSILMKSSCQMAFCYDLQLPPEDIDTHRKIIIENWQKDKNYSNGNLLIPIIHGSNIAIPKLCKLIAKETRSTVIAVPERCLGDSLIERARIVTKIRFALNENGEYTKLHLLGTGNPISIAVYSIMGADSFDGLEWCQTVVDPETACLSHFSQADLFWDKGGYSNENLPFTLKTLVHNIEFYSGWMKDLQSSILSNTEIEFCESRFSHDLYSKISKTLDWRKSS